MTLAKPLAFLWKDWVQAKSYRLGFIVENASLLAPLLMLFFLGRLFNPVDVPAIHPYGGNYATFAFVGLVVMTYSFTGLRAFSTGVRQAQVAGTLEVLLLTKARLPTIIVGWSMFPFVQSTVHMVVTLVLGFLILGLQLDNANPLGALLVVLITVVVMASVGVIAAGFTLLFKQGEPFTGLLVAVSGLISGTLYPVSVLPGWLQGASQLLPQTHTIEAMRLALLRGASIADLSLQLMVLLLFALVLAPLAMMTFRYATYRARRDGTLAHY